MPKQTKLLTTILLYFLFCHLHAQLVIGKSEVSNNSILLEFGNEPMGIILPSVENAPGATGGTFIFDTTDHSVKVLEERNAGANDNWTNMTLNTEPGISHVFENTGSDLGEGVIIGAETTSKPGILVLESDSRAIVLPNVPNPHLNMPGVIAGTMVYDSAVSMIAVFDGTNWSYWN